MAARNLTIDSAPTRPKDKARDDLTTVMISIVVIASSTKLEAQLRRLDSDDPQRT